MDILITILLVLFIGFAWGLMGMNLKAILVLRKITKRIKAGDLNLDQLKIVDEIVHYL